MTPLDTLSLPVLEFRKRHYCGVIWRVIDLPHQVQVSASRALRISPRLTETAYRIATDEEFVVTARPRLPRPDGVTAVLTRVGSDGLKWQSHQVLDELTTVFGTPRWAERRKSISDGWTDAFRYRTEAREESGATVRSGLRAAQIGALHAIGAHWSLSREPATVVMPTGTGKTEVMVASVLCHAQGTVLVVVPSDPLRSQTAHKFANLGLLRALGLIAEEVKSPIVGIMTRRPRSNRDLDIFDQCHVVVATMSALAQGSAVALGPSIARKCDALVVDEAHHVPAKSWTGFVAHFAGKKVLQFTATPFRRDGKLVGGKTIYNYPLRAAQKDGYFKPIKFIPINELDSDAGDRAVATEAIAQLGRDRAAGYEHLLMARCASIARAKGLRGIYQELAPGDSPVVVHSELPDASRTLEEVRAGQHRIIICVDMLGEGFDLPRLKVAAIHDTHKSLGVLLQFTGRFTRAAGDRIGDATVIANIADQDVALALERLYSEDADWNHLLSEFSSEAVRAHMGLVAFLQSSERLDEREEVGSVSIAPSLLRPKYSAVVFEAQHFEPKHFHKGLPDTVNVERVWLHEASNTLYFVTRRDPEVDWTRSRQLHDRQWDLFVIHFDPARRLLYLHSSDKSSVHEAIAKAVTRDGALLVRGDRVFRVLGRVNRLVFHNIGVKKHGRRNLRYALYTGANVREALGIAETAGSVKNNLFGAGYENGGPVTIGCSIKGRLWARHTGAIPEFVQWVEGIGDKLNDTSIDTTHIIDNVLIPDEITQVPSEQVLSIEWPTEIIGQAEERVLVGPGEEPTDSVGMYDLAVASIDQDNNVIRFQVRSRDSTSVLALRLGVEEGFLVEHVSGPKLRIAIGRVSQTLEAFLSDYPPLVRFVDLSELDGNLLVKPRDLRQLEFPMEQLEAWDWNGIDLQTESIWRAGEERPNSIQAKAAAHFAAEGCELIFDDDGSGEAADLVCLKEEGDVIRLTLVHCKFAGGDPGRRVADVVEVCSQAVRSGKWKWRFRDLLKHIANRERRLRIAERPSRFLVGGPRELMRFTKLARLKSVRAEIAIVQPGIRRSGLSAEQNIVLASADAFLKETIDVSLDVICSE